MCDGGRWSCSLPDDYEDSETVCDGLDNDCDGKTDEGVTPPPERPQCSGPGECATGLDQCVGGTWMCTFMGAVEAEETSCDGRDNDCDGATDEQLDNCECMDGQRIPCGIETGECTLGEQTCLAGTWSQCDGVAPTPETDSPCDGLDNDCNGTADDGLLNACLTCGALPDEVCDGVDNDCDGLVDEKSNLLAVGCDPLPLKPATSRTTTAMVLSMKVYPTPAVAVEIRGANRVTASTMTAMGRLTKMLSLPQDSTVPMLGSAHRVDHPRVAVQRALVVGNPLSLNVKKPDATFKTTIVTDK